jgi:hypothetical protein
MTELARPTSTRVTMTEAKTKGPHRGVRVPKGPFQLDTGRRFTEGAIRALHYRKLGPRPPLSPPPLSQRQYRTWIAPVIA